MRRRWTKVECELRIGQGGDFDVSQGVSVSTPWSTSSAHPSPRSCRRWSAIGWSTSKRPRTSAD